MLRATVKVLLVDVVLVAAVVSVLQDLGWRTFYAASVHTGCPVPGCAYTPSFSYGVLTRVFAMSGRNINLVSPPTLDWVQVFAVALLAVNAWFAYEVYKALKNRPGQTKISPAIA